MVQTLYSNGANSIWEHSLLDPASVMSGKRKANPHDKLQWVTAVEKWGRREFCRSESFSSFFHVSCCPKSPNKSEFIKAKYQMLAFVHRMPCREDDSSTANDLSKVLRHVSLHKIWVKNGSLFVFFNSSSFIYLSNFIRVFAPGTWRLVWGCCRWERKLISFTL